MSHQLEEEMDQEKIARLTREILADQYQSVILVGWKAKPPDVVEGVEFTCTLRFHGEEVIVHGTGADFLMVVFEAFRRKFGERFASLLAWREPTSFHTHEGLHLELLTRRGGPQRFRFTEPLKDREVNDALIAAMVRAVEFCVNAERAYAATLQGLTRAQKEGRVDLIGTHIERLASLVDVADFQEVVALIRAGQYPSL